MELNELVNIIKGYIFKPAIVAICAAALACNERNTNINPIASTDPLIPSLTLVVPNGYETLEIGSTYIARWTSRNVPADLSNLSIDVRLVDSNGIKTHLATSTNDGQESFIVPSVPEGPYRAEVGTTLDTKVIADQSDHPFSIISPSLPAITPQTQVKTFVIAGDIAMPESIEGAYATANLLGRIHADIIGTAGDHAYQFGNQAEYNALYLPTWGRHRANTRPAKGNHDSDPYYFVFFGLNAGPAGRGYYDYMLGNWHMIVLDSNTPNDSVLSEGSAQYKWLEDILNSRPDQKCTLVYFHHPPISAGRNGDQPQMRRVWRLLYEKKVDIVVTGHDHNYQRFILLDEAFNPDPRNGTLLIIAGTAGAVRYELQNRYRSITAARDNTTWGVAKFNLMPDRYDLEFIPAEGLPQGKSGSFHDFSSGVCHANTPINNLVYHNQ